MTAAIGKWHLTPDNQQGSSGPFNRWPSGLGFDYYWGFLGGEAGQYDPLITENQKVLGVPEGKDGKPYYFPDDMAEKAIDWLHRVRAERPERPGSCTTRPAAATRRTTCRGSGRTSTRASSTRAGTSMREETLARQKELGVVPPDTELPENDAFPKWDSLSETEKRLYARQMETYAGYSENADWNVGRVLVRDRGDGRARQHPRDLDLGRQRRQHGGHPLGHVQRADDAERDPAHHRAADGAPVQARRARGLGRRARGAALLVGVGVGEQLPLRLGQAGRLPPRRHARPARHPLPEGDLRPGRHAQPLHARDRHRADRARDRRDPGARRTSTGSSRSRCTASPSPTRSRTRTRPSGTRSSTSRRSATGRCTRTAGGSRCGCRASPGCSTPRRCATSGPGWDPDADPVELYYLPDDFSQAKNLADEHPEKVEELRKLFWEEAERYQVLPILGGLSSFYGIVPPIPKVSKFTYRGRIENVAAGMIPRIYNHSYTISADLVVPEGGVEGVIVAAFDHLGGFALYVQDGKLKHHYSMLGVLEYTQAAETPLPTGEVSVEMVFAADEPKPATGGEVTLLVNGEPVASGRMEHTVPARFSGYAGMDIGCDNGLVVDRSYADKAPFRFTGEIKQVTFDIAPHMSEEDMQALHEHAAQALAAHAASA